MKKTKTQQAFDELSNILLEISQDGVINADEFKRIMTWRSCWRTVVRRVELRPFDDWLNEAIADREIDQTEKDELLQWAIKISKKYEFNNNGTIESFKSGDDYLDFPRSRRPTWHADPATAKQIAFLLDLGESENNCRGLTKGQASLKIDELLDSGRRRKTRSGCSFIGLLFLTAIALTILIMTVHMG